MSVCLIVGVLITGCGPTKALTPADAVRVLTSNTRPCVAPMAIAPQYVTPVPHDPNWPFLTPSTPTRPLAPPWSVTTYYGRNHVETFFNGRSFVDGSDRAMRRPGRAQPRR